MRWKKLPSLLMVTPWPQSLLLCAEASVGMILAQHAEAQHEGILSDGRFLALDMQRQSCPIGEGADRVGTGNTAHGCALVCVQVGYLVCHSKRMVGRGLQVIRGLLCHAGISPEGDGMTLNQESDTDRCDF